MTPLGMTIALNVSSLHNEGMFLFKDPIVQSPDTMWVFASNILVSVPVKEIMPYCLGDLYERELTLKFSGLAS